MPRAGFESKIPEFGDGRKYTSWATWLLYLTLHRVLVNLLFISETEFHVKEEMICSRQTVVGPAVCIGKDRPRITTA
jgi:hypothetical protein